ncbi:hypothetical protein SNEBB_006556 [Seison nebaliae]|nr:hypothetical protein SNEBB_006556 [Seison nebaliae]
MSTDYKETRLVVLYAVVGFSRDDIVLESVWEGQESVPERFAKKYKLEYPKHPRKLRVHKERMMHYMTDFVMEVFGIRDNVRESVRDIGDILFNYPSRLLVTTVGCIDVVSIDKTAINIVVLPLEKTTRALFGELGEKIDKYPQPHSSAFFRKTQTNESEKYEKCGQTGLVVEILVRRKKIEENYPILEITYIHGHNKTGPYASPLLISSQFERYSSRESSSLILNSKDNEKEEEKDKMSIIKQPLKKSTHVTFFMDEHDKNKDNYNSGNDDNIKTLNRRCGLPETRMEFGHPLNKMILDRPDSMDKGYRNENYLKSERNSDKYGTEISSYRGGTDRRLTENNNSYSDRCHYRPRFNDLSNRSSNYRDNRLNTIWNGRYYDDRNNGYEKKNYYDRNNNSYSHQNSRKNYNNNHNFEDRRHRFDDRNGFKSYSSGSSYNNRRNDLDQTHRVEMSYGRYANTSNKDQSLCDDLMNNFSDRRNSYCSDESTDKRSTDNSMQCPSKDTQSIISEVSNENFSHDEREINRYVIEEHRIASKIPPVDIRIVDGNEKNNEELQKELKSTKDLLELNKHQLYLEEKKITEMSKLMLQVKTMLISISTDYCLNNPERQFIPSKEVTELIEHCVNKCHMDQAVQILSNDYDLVRFNPYDYAIDYHHIHSKNFYDTLHLFSELDKIFYYYVVYEGDWDIAKVVNDKGFLLLFYFRILTNEKEIENFDPKFPCNFPDTDKFYVLRIYIPHDVYCIPTLLKAHRRFETDFHENFLKMYLSSKPMINDEKWRGSSNGRFDFPIGMEMLIQQKEQFPNRPMEGRKEDMTITYETLKQNYEFFGDEKGYAIHHIIDLAPPNQRKEILFMDKNMTTFTLYPIHNKYSLKLDDCSNEFVGNLNTFPLTNCESASGKTALGNILQMLSSDQVKQIETHKANFERYVPKFSRDKFNPIRINVLLKMNKISLVAYKSDNTMKPYRIVKIKKLCNKPTDDFLLFKGSSINENLSSSYLITPSMSEILIYRNIFRQRLLNSTYNKAVLNTMKNEDGYHAELIKSIFPYYWNAMNEYESRELSHPIIKYFIVGRIVETERRNNKNVYRCEVAMAPNRLEEEDFDRLRLLKFCQYMNYTVVTSMNHSTGAHWLIDGNCKASSNFVRNFSMSSVHSGYKYDDYVLIQYVPLTKCSHIVQIINEYYTHRVPLHLVQLVNEKLIQLHSDKFHSKEKLASGNEGAVVTDSGLYIYSNEPDMHLKEINEQRKLAMSLQQGVEFQEDFIPSTKEPYQQGNVQNIDYTKSMSMNPAGGDQSCYHPTNSLNNISDTRLHHRSYISPKIDQSTDSYSNLNQYINNNNNNNMQVFPDNDLDVNCEVYYNKTSKHPNSFHKFFEQINSKSDGFESKENGKMCVKKNEYHSISSNTATKSSLASIPLSNQLEKTLSAETGERQMNGNSEKAIQSEILPQEISMSNVNAELQISETENKVSDITKSSVINHTEVGMP